ncbi:hypothetical protein [Mesorhizobium sp.]|jgi:hypothetical protein|uniref:hypothetical protein n=1 Tax=Mesorhizobium sp. TaxID=1871066 RepID=UPI000FE40438|nr:hypothetical protein [Mesorhizobium sp.]RWH73411.1 MAG: hypothetical protein EOQ84_07265 [Mesorhizobium sp.]RWL25630.1 MAG: hypothetical protein EOR58_19485 [Mesorhizobium sp.]RWL36477.1 MAG: hypothetical protein EOR63_00540 [Mesorhizobium sp.]RWL40763.1 MAG: hypothetical protein EOR59_04745 [Mesorhizobium sp.]RWL54472.1 MAG: hypothetical protein EOR62_12030 [Mesorhizobium sp.]
MPMRQKAHDAGVFLPADLNLLARVFDRLKVDGQTADQREVLASRILANFMAGIEDEEEIVSLSQLPLGRSHMS